MSVYTMKYVYEKGADIVAAFDIDEKKVGKDISTIIGCENKGVVISNIKDAEKIEEIMEKLVPREEMLSFCHRIVAH